MLLLKKSKLYSIVCFMTGFLGFSILGQYILLEILHLPFAFIEIYYIPIIVIKFRKIQVYMKKVIHRCSVKTFFLLYFILISGIMTVGSNGDILAVRSIVYLIIAVDFIEWEENIQFYNLYFICLGSVVGEVFFRFVLDTNEMMSSMNCITFVACIFIPYCLKSYCLMFFSAFILLLFSINTGYRIGIIVVLLSVGIILAHLLLREKRKNVETVRQILVIGIISIAWLLFRRYYLDVINAFADFTKMSSFARFRVTSRLQGLLEGNTEVSQDSARWEMYKLILKDFLTHIYPIGIVRANGDYIDVPILFLYDALGSVVTLSIFISMIIKMIKMFFTTLKSKVSEYNIFIVLELVIILFLVIVNGTFLKNTYQAIITGIMIGTFINFSRRQQ